MPRKKKALEQSPEAEADAAFALLLEEDTKLVSIEDPLPVEDEIVESVPDDGVTEELTSSVSEYLRRQVYQETYGTDEPSNHDRVILALKERKEHNAY